MNQPPIANEIVSESYAQRTMAGCGALLLLIKISGVE